MAVKNPETKNPEMKNLDMNTLFYLLDHCKLGIIITDADGRILWGNQYYSMMAGFDVRDFIGQDIRIISRKKLVTLYGPVMVDQVLESKSELTTIVTYPSEDFIATTLTPVFSGSGTIEYLVYSVTNCSESIRMQSELHQLNARNLALESQLNEILTSSLLSKDIIVSDIKMKQIYKIASRLASVTTSVMILGESGVGKDVYAKFIHSISSRKDRNFIHVNLGAIPKSLFESELFGYEPGAFTGASKTGKIGLIELANGGTLFLDEIGELGLDIQAKLLQVVQERSVRRIGSAKTVPLDIRIIAATNRNLEQMVKEGRFRLDLYYRLNVVTVEIPPLRERRVEIPLLVNVFLDRFNQKYSARKTMDSSAMDVLMNHDWPGNIRELMHLVESLVVIGTNDIITLSELPSSLISPAANSVLGIMADMDPLNLNLKNATALLEKRLIREALKQYKTTTAAAEAMGIDISTLSKKRKKYGI